MAYHKEQIYRWVIGYIVLPGVNGKIRKDLRKLADTVNCSAVYLSKKEALKYCEKDIYDDGTCVKTVPVKIKIEIVGWEETKRSKK